MIESIKRLFTNTSLSVGQTSGKPVTNPLGANASTLDTADGHVSKCQSQQLSTIGKTKPECRKPPQQQISQVEKNALPSTENHEKMVPREVLLLNCVLVSLQTLLQSAMGHFSGLFLSMQTQVELQNQARLSVEESIQLNVRQARCPNPRQFSLSFNYQCEIRLDLGEFPRSIAQLCSEMSPLPSNSQKLSLTVA